MTTGEALTGSASTLASSAFFFFELVNRGRPPLPFAPPLPATLHLPPSPLASGVFAEPNGVPSGFLFAGPNELPSAFLLGGPKELPSVFLLGGPNELPSGFRLGGATAAESDFRPIAFGFNLGAPSVPASAFVAFSGSSSSSICCGCCIFNAAIRFCSAAFAARLPATCAALLSKIFFLIFARPSSWIAFLSN